MLSTKLFQQQVIPLFFSPKGRISRGLFWKANLLLLLVYFSLFSIFIIAEHALALTSDQLVIGILIVISFFWYVVFVLTVKRLHDINWSGWLAIPCILTCFLWLIAGLIAGKSGENKHGANPVEYESDRLFVNKGKGIPPPPPPLDNPVSKVVLCLMLMLPIPSLVIAGIFSSKEDHQESIESNLESDGLSSEYDESQYLVNLMEIYNHPETAPEVEECNGNIYCNAFVALSKQWEGIPDSYRYKGEWDIKTVAKEGVTYDDNGRNIGLINGFYFFTERTNQIKDSIEGLIETEGQDYEGGLAVLLYIEDTNGWTKENQPDETEAKLAFVKEVYSNELNEDLMRVDVIKLHAASELKQLILKRDDISMQAGEMCDWVRSVLIYGQDHDTRLEDMQFNMLDNGLVRAEYYNFGDKHHLDFDIQCDVQECKIADIYGPNSYKQELQEIVKNNFCTEVKQYQESQMTS